MASRTALPKLPHIEQHFTASESVRDVVIGMSDGLTVPFALAAGISGAVASTGLVVTAGLAEIAAGSIAMGLGGYLAARGDAEHYASERKREEREVEELPDVEAKEVADILVEFGMTQEHAMQAVDAMKRNKNKWIDFMMRFELGLEEPDPRRALRSAITIGLSYIAGGLVPLLPYIFIANAQEALVWSCVLTLIALGIFGGAKARFSGASPWRGVFQTMIVGGIAAAAAFGLAKAFSH